MGLAEKVDDGFVALNGNGSAGALLEKPPRCATGSARRNSPWPELQASGQASRLPGPKRRFGPDLPMTSAMRVLLCDDVPELRLLLRLGLEDEADVEVVGEAATGAEALDLVAAIAPDVVLLDFDMPVMSGPEALPRLRRLHPAPRVIAFVGAVTEAVEARAMALGAERCLDKSAGIDAVAEAIRTPVAPAALAG